MDGHSRYKVWAWISDQVGPRGTVRLTLPVALLALVATVAPALANAASSTSPGQLYAFGDNRYGQLGNAANNGSEKPNPTPTLVTLPGASGPATQVAAGGNHSLVLTSSGQLYAFGGNFYGQLGNATNNGTGALNPTPTLVTLPGAIGPGIQIAAGFVHSLVLTSSHQLYAFGQNDYGELGNSTNDGTEAPNPTPTLVTLPGAIGPVIQIAAGGFDSFALTASGQLYAFGENQYGQLGNATNNGTGAPNPTPTLVTLPGAIGPATQVAASGNHSLVLTSSGQVYAFGENHYGQLGNAINNGIGANGTGAPNPTPTQVWLSGASGPVVQITAGAFFSLALTSSGQLYAFGDNRYGQLGNAESEKPNPTPSLVTLAGASGQVTQIAAGAFSSFALTSGGQLYAFGENHYGQLGNATTQDSIPTPTLVTMPAAAKVNTMARGSDAFHTLVVVDGLTVLSDSLRFGTVGSPYRAQMQGGGGAPPYTWSAINLPPGLSIDQTSGAISGTPTTAGSYPTTFTVMDSDGIQNQASLAITIKAAAALSPLITSVHQSASRWREGNKLAQISQQEGKKKKTPLGTTFSFSLNERAAVTLRFTQTVTGRRVSRKCLAKTDRNAASCKRSLSMGTLTFRGHKNVNRVVFEGPLSRSKKLWPGRYTLIITANSAGARSTPVALHFTIVR